jgi:hypothetical protein
MALSADRNTTYRDGIELEFPVKAATKIYAGSMVCVGAADGYAIPAADAAGNIFVGVAVEQADNSSGANAAINVRVRRKGVFDFAASSILQAHVGDVMYVVDDQTFDETTPGNSVVAGILVKYVSATRGWIDIEAGVRVGATIAASAISVADAGNYFEAGATTAEQVLQEIGAELAIYNKGVVFPWAVKLEDGTALTKHSAAPTPGFAQLSNKEVVLQWAKHATPGEAAALFVLPDDLDGTAAVEFHIMGCVDGTDTPTVTTECYIGIGDTDCGGATTEMTAGASTMNEEYVSIAHGNVPDGGPAPVTVLFNPTDGQLGNDNCYCYGMWLEYTKKKTA